MTEIPAINSNFYPTGLTLILQINNRSFNDLGCIVLLHFVTVSKVYYTKYLEDKTIFITHSKSKVAKPLSISFRVLLSFLSCLSLNLVSSMCLVSLPTPGRASELIHL